MRGVLSGLACGAAWLIASSAAQAQCPESRLQQATDRFNAAEQAGAVLQQLAGEAAAEIQTCSADPHVMKVASMTLINIAQKTENGEAALGWVDAGWRAFVAMHDALPADTPPPRKVEVGVASLDIGFGDLRNLAQITTATLFDTERRAGKLSSATQPAEPGKSYFKTCNVNHVIMAQRIDNYIRQQTPHPGARNLLDRLAASCSASQNLNAGQVRAVRASVFRKLARDHAANPQSVEFLKRVVEDSHDVMTHYPDGLSIFWNRSEANSVAGELAAAIYRHGGEWAPKSDWFKPENLRHPAVVAAIGSELDLAWAEDAKVGVSGAYANFRKVISDAYAEINKLEGADNDKARWMLFSAANQYAGGDFRRAENTGLPAPPGFLYTWIRPGGSIR